MAKLENFEIVKCGPYRFIGKAVYVRNDWGKPYSATGKIVKSCITPESAAVHFNN